jgi:hypothetical protein
LSQSDRLLRAKRSHALSKHALEVYVFSYR